LKSNNVVVYGGAAGGGKTWLAAEKTLVYCYLYPGYKSFIGRDELKRIMASFYPTWVNVCQYHDIPQEDWTFNGQYGYILFKNGSRIDFLDLKFLPSDPLYERFG
jgi:phage terminase large subunit